MILIAGIVPHPDFPLVQGTVEGEENTITVTGCSISISQGTGAMLGAALATTRHLGTEPPCALLAGDTGRGDGSHRVYEYLIQNLRDIAPDVLALHYWLPNMAQTIRLCDVLEKMEHRPIVIADAASMYSAKAAGKAPLFDIFTPDATELAFLADPEATHPAYINHHLFDTAQDTTLELAAAAWRQNNAARVLLVKGSVDYIIEEGEVIEEVSEPCVPALEAIGGTGDTVTGLTAALADAGLEPWQAALLAARANRVAGEKAQPSPETGVGEIVGHIPLVLRENLCEWSGICSTVRGE